MPNTTSPREQKHYEENIIPYSPTPLPLPCVQAILHPCHTELGPEREGKGKGGENAS